MSQKRKDARRKNSDKVFAHYGGECAACGIADRDVLTIDHIDQNGAKHRESGVGSGRFFHKWLVDNGFPPGYRTLCFNCNIKAWRQHQRGNES